ncbi:MAG: hypothetical protein RLZZ187_1356 [Pseudomonadota bacterium]
MRQAAGQVARQAHRALHLLLGTLMLGLLALAVLGWRLAQGPIELPWLARIIEAEAAPRDAAFRLEIGQASIGWEGLHSAGLSPLQLRLAGVRLVGADGTLRAALPDAEVGLSLPWLLRGHVAPRRLEFDRPMLRLARDAEGGLLIALAPPGVEAAPGSAGLEAILAGLMHAPDDHTPLGALAQLAVTGAQLVVEDAQLGVTWSLDNAAIELRRGAAGGIAGRFNAVLQLGAERIPLAGSIEARGSPAEITLRLALPELRPAALSALAPPLAALAALDAPARLDLSVRMDMSGAVQEAGLVLGASAGTLDLGAGRRLKLARLDAAAEWQAERLRLTRANLTLDGPGTPRLSAQGEATRRDGGWRGRATLGLDALPVAELGRWWPEGLGSGERAWILENITAGVARNGHWQVEAEAAEDLSGLAVTALSGTLDVADATVHWLRPIPPVEGAQGQVRFGLDAIEVEVAAARQAGTQVAARDALLRFTFPDGQDPAAEMRIGLAGPVPEVLGVLRHPRLRLFDRRPLPLVNPQGVLDGRLDLGFPLLDALQIEQMQIRAQAQLRQVRLGDILFGKPLERGQFELNVDTNGLRATGTATLAEIPARLAVEMDFRGGPPGQVVMRETVTARPDARQLAALGLAAEDVLRGPVALDVRTERRRNGQGRVLLRADLREAALAIEPLAWSKPQGQNAGAEAVLRLTGENLEAVESFRIEAPSLLLRGNAAFARGARLERVTINEGRVDDSRFSGEARPPARPGTPWTVTLRGPVLDLQRMMADDTPSGPPGAEPGPAVAIDARFERVLLGPQRALQGLEARVQLDGRGVLRDGRIAGRTGPQKAFEATITPAERGRALRVTAEDAGALLRAFGVLRTLDGGQLNVTAAYAHNGPGAPLRGTAEMENFVVQNAPAVAKLLQAMTLYGMVEALSGPGLGFARMVAPFTLTPDALVLEEARAFSASLGLTAKGTLDRRRQALAMEGTIVPAYLFNTLLGNIPLLGRLFSPETGGGLFAATFRMQGPLDDPQVSVNPLAALTPGFLRGLFGLGQTSDPPAARP